MPHCAVIEMEVMFYMECDQVFGRGGEEMDFLQEQGIKVNVVPGTLVFRKRPSLPQQQLVSLEYDKDFLK